MFIMAFNCHNFCQSRLTQEHQKISGRLGDTRPQNVPSEPLPMTPWPIDRLSTASFRRDCRTLFIFILLYIHIYT